MRTDSLYEIEQWYHPELVMKQAVLLAAANLMRTEYNKYSIAENVQNFMVILTTTAYFETPLFCRCKRVRNEGNLLLYSHRDMKYKHAPGTQFITGFLESIKYSRRKVVIVCWIQRQQDWY